ncbi:MAG: hypothetical protein OXC62_13775 [Aestuariivita sp.]|nr:hypothetical protein [Aestuariivita sp.]
MRLFEAPFVKDSQNFSYRGLYRLFHDRSKILFLLHKGELQKSKIQQCNTNQDTKNSNQYGCFRFCGKGFHILAQQFNIGFLRDMCQRDVKRILNNFRLLITNTTFFSLL